MIRLRRVSVVPAHTILVEKRRDLRWPARGEIDHFPRAVGRRRRAVPLPAKQHVPATAP